MNMQSTIPNADQAACIDADPELFFLEDEDGDKNSPIPGVSRSNYASYQKAVSLCQQCPITLECLTAALNDKAEYGIWGGTTPKMRKRMKHEPQAVKFVTNLKKGVNK